MKKVSLIFGTRPEAIAWRMGYIDDNQIARMAAISNNAYSNYLKELLQ